MGCRSDLFSTYSIVARDPQTGEIGGAVQTHQMCVGSIVLWMLPGRGALATQSLVNIGYGPITLAMLREGVAPERIITALAASDADAHRRQMGLVDAQGRAAAWTGEGCIREAGHRTGENFSVQANMMTRPTVVEAMAGAFSAARGDLAARLMAAMEAAQAEGGDIRGMQSAALRIVPGNRDVPDWTTVYDLRVDEHEEPLRELGRLVRLRRALVLDDRGTELLVAGQREEALRAWAQARAEAPEMEEIPFWQAVTLANEHDDIETAAAILRPALADDPRRAHWIDLIDRLAECGLIKQVEVAERLKAALG